MLVALEGVDYSGKTTVATILQEKYGIDVVAMPFRETKQFISDPYTYQIMATADRIKVNSTIDPEKDNIVFDRYAMSTLVYGVTQGLPFQFAHGLIKPHLPGVLYVVFTVSPAELERRMKQRGSDKIGNLDFLLRVNRMYSEIANLGYWNGYRVSGKNGQKSAERLASEVVGLFK